MVSDTELSATGQMVEALLDARDARIAELEQRVAELEQQLAQALGQRVIQEDADGARLR